MEKMSSGNADTAFVRNCDLDSAYMARIQCQDCVAFQCINVLHSIMEIMLLWISKYQKGFLKMELLLLYVVVIFINCMLKIQKVVWPKPYQPDRQSRPW